MAEKDAAASAPPASGVEGGSSASAAASGGAAPSSFSCAVCYVEELPLSERVTLPCCGREGSSIQYCATCLGVLCASMGGVGRCPTCSKHFRIEGGRATAAEELAQCSCCRQLRPGVLRGGGGSGPPLCAACTLGVRLRLSYECETCHRKQTIPHPMFLYQPTPVAFSTDTWACHNAGCPGEYTHWRIVNPADIPPEHCPEGWGRRDEWLAAVRAQSLALRGGGAEPSAAAAAATEPAVARLRLCVIL